ncbi:unnamed protein product [Caenorhabditis auriculariae]|uniref:Serpentine receptor class gamma n=1 Tax=Caenorhabditis auriculariae TaxID=2777116 RepID=A0A8S1HAQ0_9PELO|nr:unnamed protein product [Caenorhabditis auriculariae]
MPKPQGGIKWYTIAFLIYGIPTIFLTVCLFILLCFHKAFKSSFYRLVQINFLVSVACYANTWYSLRLPLENAGYSFILSIERHLPGTMTWAQFLLAWFFHMQNITTFTLCLHRLTSTIFSNCADKFWRRYYLLFFVGSGLLSTLFMSPWIFGERFLLVKILDGNYVQNLHPQQFELLTQYNFLCALLYFTVIPLTAVWSNILISRKMRAVGYTAAERYSQKLSRITFAISLVHFGNFSYTIEEGIATTFGIRLIPADTVGIFVSFASDAVTLALPYILLLFDSNLRQVLRRSVAVTPHLVVIT